MNRLFAICVFTLGLSALGHASPPPPARPAFTPAELRATLAAMPKGDSARGKQISQLRMCASCHGETGTAPTRNWAGLAQQTPAYTYKSLLDYQRGGRNENPRARLMHVAVDGMSMQEMADVAAFYASQPLAQSATARSPHAEQLARHGDRKRLLTACASCHGASGQGGRNATPALAGQNPAAFTRTLLDYRDGHRATDAHQGMRQFARRLTLQEINELAAYYAALQ
ncbi:MAG: c-type cytochrome [Thiobacillus sp.]|jgi:cytochrome c553|nr:c-type cytochrome [Thiobacillus sp.]